MEIVTSARRDVRQIVMEARRELLVLSAQVQAALGEAGARPDPAALLNRTRDTDDGASESSGFSDTLFAPEEAVKGMLDEARADMDALAEDARTVPFQALREPPALMPPPEPSILAGETFIASLAPPPQMSSVSPSPAVSSLSPATSRMLLSSPFPSDAVPVPPGHRVRTFVTFFGLAGIVVLAGTIWWLRSPDATTADAAARSAPAAISAPSDSKPPAVSPAASSTPAATPAAPAANTAARSSNLSLLVEARGSAWLRSTIDGESDSGRTLAKGETFRITAQRSVSLRVGDAGAVFVSVNNGEALPLGRAGQVVTRQFVVESGNREGGVTQPQPTPAVIPKPEPLAPPVASGSRPVLAPAPNPSPVALVQPVAAAPASAPPEAAPAPAPRPEPPRAETVVPSPAPRAELPTPGPSTPASAVVAASRQWLDAYHRQDRAAMASLSSDALQLADERRNEERFPAGVDVNRTLDASACRSPLIRPC